MPQLFTLLRDSNPDATGSGPASPSPSAPDGNSTPNVPGSSGYNPFAPAKPSTNAKPADPSPAAPSALGADPSSPSPSTGLGAGGPTGVAESPAGAAAPSTPPPVQPPAPQVINLSPEAIAALRQPIQAPRQAPQITDADFKRHFNVVEVDANRFKAIHGFDGAPEQVAAYNETLQGVARQAVTIARHLISQQKEELTSMISPIQATTQAQLEERYTTDFYTQHPYLRDYHPLCQEIVKGIQSRGQRFASPAEAMKFVAENAIKLAKITVPQGNGTPGAQPQQPSVQPAVSRPLTTVSTGGRSGTGGSATEPVPTAKRIFG